MGEVLHVDFQTGQRAAGPVASHEWADSDPSELIPEFARKIIELAGTPEIQERLDALITSVEAELMANDGRISRGSSRVIHDDLQQMLDSIPEA